MTVIKKSVAACSVAAVVALTQQLAPGELRTSQNGLLLIGQYEDCRLRAYHDTVGIPTIGVGSTKNVQMGDSICIEEAAMRMVADVKEAEQCVNRYFNGQRMPQPVYDSVTSLVYNVGCYGTRWNKARNRPTSIALYAQNGNWPMVCTHIGDFNKAGGKVSSGLDNRRKLEQANCRGERK